MGYSLTVTMKSQKVKAEMLAFLEEHFRTATTIDPGGLMSFSRGERTFTHHDSTGNLGDNEGLKLGFWKAGPTNHFTSLYVYSTMAWVALRGGKRRTYAKRLGVKESVPYWVHDLHAGYPVLVRSEWEGRVDLENLVDVDVVDEHGFRSVEKTYGPDWPERFRINWPEINATVHAELKRLSELWDNRNG